MKNLMLKKLALALTGIYFAFFTLSIAVANDSSPYNFDLKIYKVPFFLQKDDNKLFDLILTAESADIQGEITSINVHYTMQSNLELVADLKAVDDSGTILQTGHHIKNEHFLSLPFRLKLKPGRQTISFLFSGNALEALSTGIEIDRIEIVFADKTIVRVDAEPGYIHRPATVLRAAGQDDCDTYRIPGLVTTNSGALIAVYDNRYNNSKDLQENIDIGMSRSTDGGQNWEPMKVIVDMGEWGGQPESLNGIGDPCILYDKKNATIWVAALWMSGGTENDMLWWISKPGMIPAETGQFMLAKSTDDGLTWSAPINITDQIKDPSWQLLLQGPGRGICMKNGTLVFPAQFKKNVGEKSLDGGQFTCHSTLVYSTDGGQHWEIGSGAKTNTTEAQVAELSDGSLMLNMRDDRNRTDKSENNGRAVAVTHDLGQTWETHPTSNSSLPEPNCMASLISTEILVNGSKKHVLFFSNPNNKFERTNMTIKASLDDGLTWPELYQIELNETGGYGYSCMSMVDENTIGILYEGVKDIYFQKIPVSDFFRVTE
jgi:sialidase-1